jgi:hypothetical protein
MSIECDCPICPLVAANIQVCDIIIKFRPTDIRLHCSDDDAEKITGLHIHFVMLAGTARNNYKLKKGECWSEEERSDCEFHIECLRKNQFKVCFHAKKKVEVLEDPI